ncbi:MULTISPECIES: hypothetical protein [Rhodanobacteraceae]|uniref:hypothetical protein n=1 Tax=Rhodanobacteraceae TaxID=1775411 RepID=UPI00088178AD|nr:MULTISPECIES: hypothetical protein [Rhodanobacteraceae]SDG22450.1 hypothetical protein SAMN04515659_2436 [Dyella sp. 333MFSha]SKB54696.1 hypothetical protein SAMN05660880_01544 [Luteibacter sp. 22Crub2.1]
MARRKAAGIQSTRVLEITSRTVAAVFGGYAMAALVASAFARWLPVARVEAVITGMLSSFAVYATVVILAFAMRSATRVWLWLAAFGLPLAGALAWSMHGSAA